ncbi:MAG: threonine synthase [Acutalibacteraceae bacterium]
MYYTSTRDSKIRIESAKAIATGISKEGGLFVPCEYPHISQEKLLKLSNEDYRTRATEVLKLFLTDFTEEKVNEMVCSAYGKKFDSSNPAPLHKLDNGTYVLELWHGPTCAFKDMALQILPYLLSASAQKVSPGKQTVILVATSGDTGKAALEGFKDVENTRILVFYPQDGVSNIQKLQMITSQGANVGVCAVCGNFDDAQTGVKKIFTNPEIIKKLQENNMEFSSANSINWGRLVPQVVYYVSAYCDLIKNGAIKCGEEINVTVPTGNFGDILAAFYAKKIGVPIKRFICASNENNVLTDFIRTGTYDKNREFHTTMSPSMDILVSSNLERLLFELSGCDDKYISEIMDELKTNGKYTVSKDILDSLKNEFSAYYCGDSDTQKSIKETFDSFGYLIDTHTSVAVNCENQYIKETEDKTVNVIVSTASPYKFSDSVLSSLKKIDAKDDFGVIDELSDFSKTEIPYPFAELRNAKPRFSDVCMPDEMPEYVLKKLGI